MVEPKPCPFCGKHLIKKQNHSRLPSGKVIDYTYWTHEDSRDCILGALLTERKGHFLMKSDIEQWNRRADNGN